jgi:DNA-binding CsgD family transcriptional regulator
VPVVERQLRLVLDIIDHVYAGVGDPRRWEDGLRSFATLLDARAAGIRVESLGVGVEQQWVGLEPSFDRAYVEEYWRDDPWAARIWASRVGDFGHGDALCARAIVEKSSFHNELALASGFDDLAGGVLERSESRVVTVGVMKGLGRKRFDDEADRLAAMVLPHFARALALRDRLAATERPSTDATVPSGEPNGAPNAAPNVAIEERLRARYGLTAAEARVAMRVGRGQSPKEVAIELGSSWYTVRSQLRQIFAKTERRSQSALTRLVTLLEAELALERSRFRA